MIHKLYLYLAFTCVVYLVINDLISPLPLHLGFLPITLWSDLSVPCSMPLNWVASEGQCGTVDVDINMAGAEVILSEIILFYFTDKTYFFPLLISDINDEICQIIGCRWILFSVISAWCKHTIDPVIQTQCICDNLMRFSVNHQKHMLMHSVKSAPVTLLCRFYNAWYKCHTQDGFTGGVISLRVSEVKSQAVKEKSYLACLELNGMFTQALLHWWPQDDLMAPGQWRLMELAY